MEYGLLALSISLLGIFVHNWVTTSTLRERLARLETRFDLLFSHLEKRIAEELISPESPELDALLEKLISGQAEGAELDLLRAELEEEFSRAKGCRRLAIGLALSLVEARARSSPRPRT